MKDEKTIVLGIGNSILGDDGIGLKVVEDLSKSMDKNIDFIQTEEMGFSLLDYMISYDRAIIIDSIQAGGIPGTIHLLSINDFEPNSNLSNHYVGLPELSMMAKQMGLKFPYHVHIIGIEIADPYTITTCFSKEIETNYIRILDKVKEEIMFLSNFELEST